MLGQLIGKVFGLSFFDLLPQHRFFSAQSAWVVRNEIERFRVSGASFGQVPERGEGAGAFCQQIRAFRVGLHDDEFLVQNRYALIELLWIEQVP